MCVDVQSSEMLSAITAYYAGLNASIRDAKRQAPAQQRCPPFDPSRVDELTEAQARALYRALIREWPTLPETTP